MLVCPWCTQQLLVSCKLTSKVHCSIFMVKMLRLQLLYLFFFTILGICCYFQVKESVVKYLKGSTSEFTYERVEESLQLPVLTVCPKTYKDPHKFETLMQINPFSVKVIWPKSRYFIFYKNIHVFTNLNWRYKQERCS